MHYNKKNKAFRDEIIYHKEHNVKKDNKYFNRANAGQTPKRPN
jgi:hypothetical protein